MGWGHTERGGARRQEGRSGGDLQALKGVLFRECLRTRHNDGSRWSALRPPGRGPSAKPMGTGAVEPAHFPPEIPPMLFFSRQL